VSMETFKFTPSEHGTRTPDWRIVNWKAPAGHESWCETQVPPGVRTKRIGDTAMAHIGCTCPNNALARHLRRAAGIEAPRVKRITRKAAEGCPNCKTLLAEIERVAELLAS